jgi:predicted NAD/FAD-binding protein
VFLAGAWAGYGFHEDGIKSAVDAVTAMGELRGGVRRYGLRCAVAVRWRLMAGGWVGWTVAMP